MLWEAITEGEVTFPNEETMVLTPADWVRMVQFLYKHIDGDAPKDHNVNVEGDIMLLWDSELTKDDDQEAGAMSIDTEDD